MTATTPLAQRLGSAALDLVLPRACAGCGDKQPPPVGAFCAACAPSLMRPPVPARLPPLLSSVRSAAIYGGQVAVAIQRLKYHDATFLARPLGILLSSEVTDAVRALDVAVPVPLHPRRLRRRGYNQATLLARVALRYGARTRPRLHCGLLRRVRDTPPQVTLATHGADRRRNVENAFGAADAVRGKRVLLVDDVATTGATASACAAALLSRGAAAVHLLTLARAVR